jgi:hypothetical protein
MGGADVRAIDGERDRRHGRGDERRFVDADRYVHPDIADADVLTALRAPTDATTPPTGAPSTVPPDDPPAADEERTVSTIDIGGIATTSCRGRPNRC